MTTLTTPNPMPTLGDDFLKRVESLGVTLFQTGRGGRSRVLAGESPVVQTLIASRIFEDAMARNWGNVCGDDGRVSEVLTGVFVSGLAEPQQRRRGSATPPARVQAVLMLGRGFIESELFRLICDQAEFDATATAKNLSHAGLFEADEAARMALMLGWMYGDAAALSQHSTEIRDMSSQLGDTYEELSLLYKLAANLRVNRSPKDTLVEACDDLQDAAGFSWIGLALGDDDRLEEISNALLVSDAGQARFEGLEAAAVVLKEHYADADGPVIIDDTRELGFPGFEAVSKNLLIVPMRVEGRLLGILFGGDRVDGKMLSSVDAKLCDSLAGSLTIFLDNHMLYDDAQSMFLGVLHALTSAIDAKDSYTHGHSERVALLARMLAERVGCDDHTCERVYLSGLVHDVGKIGVPEAVLCKPGKLTDEEFGLIKLHPEIGANILKDIRQMNDLVPGVLYHHEKYNGSGYPHGLAGKDIPLFGRLIGLADAFDAMSSKRTYRNAMRLEEVLDEVRRCAGTHFDPDLAAAFVGLDFQPFYGLIAKHQRMHKPA